MTDAQVLAAAARGLQKEAFLGRVLTAPLRWGFKAGLGAARGAGGIIGRAAKKEPFGTAMNIGMLPLMGTLESPEMKAEAAARAAEQAAKYRRAVLGQF